METKEGGRLEAKTWRELPIKDKAALVTACVSFVLGWLIVFVGMMLPPQGEVDGSVLTAFGTALLYTAGILGVAMYFKTGNSEVMNNLLEHMEDIIERKMKERDGTDAGN